MFASIYKAGFGSWYSWQNSLLRAAPLMLCGLCTVLPARAGILRSAMKALLSSADWRRQLLDLATQAAPAGHLPLAMAHRGAAAGGVWIASPRLCNIIAE